MYVLRYFVESLPTCIGYKTVTVLRKSANHDVWQVCKRKSANASLHSLHASLQTQVCKLFTHFPKFADMHRKVCRLTCKKFADLLCRKILHCKNKSANTSLQTQVCKHKSTKQVYNVSLQNKSANILHVSRQTWKKVVDLLKTVTDLHVQTCTKYLPANKKIHVGKPCKKKFPCWCWRFWMNILKWGCCYFSKRLLMMNIDFLNDKTLIM